MKRTKNGLYLYPLKIFPVFQTHYYHKIQIDLLKF